MNVKQQTMALTATVEKYKRNLMKRKTWYHGNQTTLYIFVLRFYLSFTISNTQLITFFFQSLYFDQLRSSNRKYLFQSHRETENVYKNTNITKQKCTCRFLIPISLSCWFSLQPQLIQRVTKIFAP